MAASPAKSDGFWTRALGVAGAAGRDLRNVRDVAPLTLTFAQPFIDIPRRIGRDLFARMDEVLQTLNAIPRDSTIWSSLLASWLVLRIDEWRFHYRIDPDLNKVVVMAAARSRTSSAA
jgi:hypothetical protein